VNQDCLKLTTYFGERDRVGDGFLADALLDLYERAELQGSVLLRGIEGFGVHHHLQSARLLTLSEDLPIVAIGVDTRERIEPLVAQVAELSTHGLVTLERARMLTDRIESVELPEDLHEGTKLTISLGRQERVGRRPAFVAIVDELHRRGVAGATVFLGVDGTRHGVRQRAKFFGRNAEVPTVVVAVGNGHTIAGALPDLGGMVEEPLMMLERVRVCKRDGKRLADPQHPPPSDPSGLGVWEKLMVYAGERTQSGGHALHVELIRRLREAGVAGATALRGVWGYHGDHAPHGDKILSITRRVPAVTSIVDRPDRIRAWYEIVDELTDEAGLVTSEIVPAMRAGSPNVERGGLRLAAGGSTP
jgi:PII-like signaling protein